MVAPGGVGLEGQLAQVPPLAGFVDQIAAGIHAAFSLAVADTFWFGLLTTVVALAVVTVGLRDVALRGAAPALDRVDRDGSEPGAQAVEVTVPIDR